MGEAAVAPELAAAMAESRRYREHIEALAGEWERKAATIDAKPFGNGQMGAADIGRAHAYRDCAKRLRKALEAP